ncbi:hypothetical protein CASFOL_032431 [Castilleja foliolosa]|uniref:F-box associated domain-containing protein n=1 Tax=Castilleja foliolosa TaxID=1961234 RepID=A0ABD3C1G0_9LAMI
MRSLRGTLHLFEVYSSETGSWRRGGELLKAYTHFDFEEGVYWNGAIHWVNIVCRPRELVNKPREPVYFSLDCDQTPKVFPKPPLKDKSFEIDDYYFGESCDHLHFVDAYRTVSEFIVYEMKKDYSEWLVKYKVNIPEMKTDRSECLMRYRNIVPEACRRYNVVVRGKNDKDIFLVIANVQRIVRYNFEEKTYETLRDFEPTFKDRLVYWGEKCPFQYIESLSSV